MPPRRLQITSRQAFIALVDAVLVFAAIVLAWALRTLDLRSVGQPGFILDIRTGASGLTVLVHLLSFYVFELYSSSVRFRSSAGVARVIAAVAVAAGGLVILFYILPFWRLSRGISLIHAGVTVLLITAWRFAFPVRRAKDALRSRTLIIGAGRMGRLVGEAIAERPERGMTVVGFLDDDPAKRKEQLAGAPVLGETDQVREMVDAHEIDTVVVAIKQPRKAAYARTVLDLKSHAIQVVHGADLYKNLTGRVPILYVDDFYFLFGRDLDRMRNPLLRNGHRLFDIGLSSLGLILSLPLLLLGMLLVKLTSRGPIFFRQERVGLNKKTFSILKLRTMRRDAEKKTGAVMSIPGQDTRVTAAGRWLRRSRIDELPQLLNVLKGDMSFIGPRPERPEFTKDFENEIPYYALRFAVKPGLTGWAQVNYRYGSDAKDTAIKLQYDLYYIQEMSLVLDVHILLKTFQTVLFRAGS